MKFINYLINSNILVDYDKNKGYLYDSNIAI